MPDALVGVGTITRAADLAAAREAGARFEVSPRLTAELADAARSTNLPFLPGVMTPTDVIAATGAGFQQLKLFPAQQAGGIGMLTAMAGRSPTSPSVRPAGSPSRRRRISSPLPMSLASAARG